MNVRGSWACSITASLPLLLGACEKTAKEESRNPVSPETGGKAESFPTLPLLWQEKGGMAEATEDLMALHVAMQRYLEANNDIWPQAPAVKMDAVVPSEQLLKEHPILSEGDLLEPNAASLAAYRKFWEDTLKPFGATARHWRHSGNPPLPGNPAFFEANRFNREKGAAYRKKNGGEENPQLRWASTPDGALGGHWWFATEVGKKGRVVFITASGRVVDTEREFVVEVPVESRNQSLTQDTRSLITINIHKNGVFIVQGKLVTEEGLTKWMDERFEKNPDLKVLIRCDIESKHLYLANMLSICNYVGVPKANIAIKTEK